MTTTTTTVQTSRNTRSDVRFCVCHPYVRPDGSTVTTAHADRDNRWQPFSYHASLAMAERMAKRLSDFYGDARVFVIPAAA